AELLEMPAAMVPVHGGVLSALGMLAARPGRQLSRTQIGLLSELSVSSLEATFAELRGQGLNALQDEGFEICDCDALASVDVRYLGQSYTLNLPWQGPRQTIEAFHAMHLQRYGHRLDLPVELVNLRQWVRGPATRVALPRLAEAPAAQPFARCRVAGIAAESAQYWRDDLVAGQVIDGPALICERVATAWVAPGWELAVDGVGNLQLSRRPASP
ncbi:MAG: hydantoinase/oxoprolinase family protein, partial [Sedimenticolaceae bacterium]